MQITYWSGFSKRAKSTKQPTGGTVAAVTLKKPTSILKPSFESATMPDTVNYIQAFGRFYKVTNVTYATNDIKVFECEEDYLASWKSDIKGTTQYVERSASATAPANVADPLNPPTNYIEKTHNLVMSFTDAIIDWIPGSNLIRDHYILAVVGKTGVEYWGLTWNEMTTFFDCVFSQNMLQQFTSQFYDYRDCVISLKKVTYVPSGDPGQQIYLGEHGVEDDQGNPITGTALNSVPYEQHYLKLLSFPADSHLNIREYPYFAPYTTGTLYLPFVGTVPLDVSMIASDGKLGVSVSVDKFTANVVYKIYNSDDQILGTYYGVAGSEIPIATQNYNPVGVGAGIIQAIGGVAAMVSGGPVAGLGAGSLVTGLGSIVSGAKTHTQVNGTISSFIGAYISQGVYADIYTNVPISWDIENMKATQGVIVNKQQSLSGASGYIQCRNASVPMAGLAAEKETVESMLNSGIYIE